MTDLNNTEQKAYSFWQQAGQWVSNHPKTTIAIALGAILIAIVVL